MSKFNVATNNNEADEPDDEQELEAHRASGEILAKLMFDAAMTAAERRRMQRKPSLTIVHVPHPNWVLRMSKALNRLDHDFVVRSVTTAPKRSAEKSGLDDLPWLQMGRSLIFISHDPAGLIEDAVIKSADVFVMVPALTPALLRKAIREMTGSPARGVTAKMCRLDPQLLMSLLRPGATARQSIERLRAAINPAASSSTVFESKTPLLDDLPLTKVVKDWSDPLVADLRAARQGQVDPSTLTYAILEGPPGTGKTLIAGSLARSAGYNFVPSSVGAWFTHGDGALGGVSRNVKAFIDEIIEKSPALGLLDEADALPDRATMDAKAREWWTACVTLVLTEIDRLRRCGKPAYLVGATNHYNFLDSALIRPGRLQKRVSVLPPSSSEEVRALLRHYLAEDFEETELEKLVRLALNHTPARVEGWTNAARARARSAGRALLLTDMIEQMVPADTRSADDQRTISIHELGHAVVAIRLGIVVKSVSIIPGARTGGHTSTRLPTLVPTLASIRAQATMMLGGRAADMVLGQGPNGGAETDLADATRLLLDARETLGLYERLSSGHALGRSLDPSALHADIESELTGLLAEAQKIVRADKVTILALADRLVEMRVLSGEEVAEALGAVSRRLDANGGREVHHSYSTS
ncbi:Peptidase family M41 [Devosia lucknowensis]|uniref:Peptidase family M41 n=1 Tax=Devosia lucknowensis TaxID=1096929 RepID=A0A1Y6GBV7_9HYPH|nr:AAA family ATPase [Devosia lucknowensis]SMQ85549.1 Peptidase family M41 [Devosia lucknowensis]